MSYRPFLAGLVLCALLGPTIVRSEQPVDESPPEQLLRDLRGDIEFLASDEMRGRSVADETIDRAATYIADRMSQIGLDAGGADSSPFQPLSVSLGARAGSAENNRVAIVERNGKFDTLIVNLADGLNPMAIGSSSGQVNGPLVFAGYGITAPKLNYDDYAAVDVSGKTVIILRKEPQVSDPSSPFAGTRNTRYAFFNTKIDNAIEHGANAVILVNDPGSVLENVQNERSKIDRELKRKQSLSKQIEELPADAVNTRKAAEQRIADIDSMVASMQNDLKRAQRGVLEISDAGERTADKDSIPVVSLARDVVDKILRQSGGRSLEQLEKAIDDTISPQSFELPGVTVTLRVELRPTLAKTSNVIGVLAGRGELADQTVVVGAHYDHVGMGGYGSLAPGTIAVHNGADDNASGTAVLLASAARLRADLAKVASHRRLVFIAFTGEERGLVGSKFYVRHPRFPLASTVAMVNLDMVGRLRDNELTVYGTGSADSMDEIVEKANQRQQFNLFKVETGYGPSDHQSFYEAGVPVLFFFTGLHNDYHRPTDDSDKIDFGGLSRITDIVSEATFELAVRKDRPGYAETENRVRIRRQMTAYLGVTLADRVDHVVVSGLAAGGPAERGGIRVGDQLEELGDSQVKNSSEVLEVMRNRSPGDELAIQLRRDGKRIVATIRLEPRPGG